MSLNRPLFVKNPRNTFQFIVSCLYIFSILSNKFSSVSFSPSTDSLTVEFNFSSKYGSSAIEWINSYVSTSWESSLPFSLHFSKTSFSLLSISFPKITITSSFNTSSASFSSEGKDFLTDASIFFFFSFSRKFSF